MSAYATSSPSMAQTRWYLIRPPSLACTWRNETSWLSVAEYSLTGTDTSPKDTAPFQIARIFVPPRGSGRLGRPAVVPSIAGARTPAHAPTCDHRGSAFSSGGADPSEAPPRWP